LQEGLGSEAYIGRFLAAVDDELDETQLSVPFEIPIQQNDLLDVMLSAR
jgi:hypothetical protein